jgi:hypothetical protein
MSSISKKYIKGSGDKHIAMQVDNDAKHVRIN